MLVDGHVTNARLGADLWRTLQAWDAPSVEQDSLRQAFLAYLASRCDALSSSCRPGHFTASCVVLNAAMRSTCLVMHPIAREWMQPGGHADDDDYSLVDIVRREVYEETGLDEVSIDPSPLQLHCHEYLCPHSGPTRHLDVRLVATTRSVSEVRLARSSEQVRWWSVNSLPQGSGELPRLVELGLVRLATSIGRPD